MASTRIKPLAAKRLDIQALRGLAVLGVILYHATENVSGGFLGVDIFFVISGYIIASTAIHEVNTTGHFSPKLFVMRRIRRLAPALAVVVTAVLLLSMLIDTPQHLARTVPHSALASLAGAANIYFYIEAEDYFGGFESNPLLNMWSLGVEIQFYLLFSATGGFFSFIIGRKISTAPGKNFKTFTRWLWIACLIASLWLALALANNWQLLEFRDIRAFSFFFTGSRLWQFSLGIIAATICTTILRRSTLRPMIWVLQIFSLLVIAYSFATVSDTAVIPGNTSIYTTLAVAFLLWSGALDTGPTNHLISNAALVWLGDRSYSVYLWQGPLIAYALTLFSTSMSALIAAMMSVALAIPTHAFIENRYRSGYRQTQDTRGKSSRGNTATYFIAVTISIVGLWAVPMIVEKYHSEPAVRATTLDSDCARQRGDNGFDPCRYHPDVEPAFRALLLGDSHAAAISQAFVDVVTNRGGIAEVATGSACAMYPHPEIHDYRPSCDGYTNRALAYLTDTPVDLVVVHQFSEIYIHRLRVGYDRWSRQATITAQDLTTTGAHVAVIGDSPRSLLSVGRPIWASQWLLDLSASVELRREIEEVERVALARASSSETSFHSTLDVLCETGGRCAVFDNGGWLYTDDDHLSVSANRLLQPLIHEVIDSAGL
ncbi:acyltransferase family protein [Fodinicurvata sp. EGI_FJ10296]|uniref:acyltransferase family protein n=1 Tax=Fodinicurvata sp. EGI_FJ10296 TaxID=3231908 RepID=UPI00345316EF